MNWMICILSVVFGNGWEDFLDGKIMVVMKNENNTQ
jgi:hypothetical protein